MTKSRNKGRGRLLDYCKLTLHVCYGVDTGVYDGSAGRGWRSSAGRQRLIVMSARALVVRSSRRGVVVCDVFVLEWDGWRLCKWKKALGNLQSQ